MSGLRCVRRYFGVGSSPASANFLNNLAAGCMQHNRHIFHANKDAEETNRNCAVVAAPMPMGPGLEECLAGVEAVARSVRGELNRQRPLEHIEIRLHRMHHPRSDGSRRYGHYVRGDNRVRSGRILSDSPARVLVSVDTSTKFAITFS